MTKARIAAIGAAGVVAIATPIIAKWEGYRPDPYYDLVGVKTVCYGETAGVEDRRYTRAECDAMLRRSVAKHEEGIRRCLPANLPPETHAAFVSAAYNVGTTAFCRSSMSRKALAGDLKGACASLSLWVYAGGRKVQGLVNRRADERRLCERGLNSLNATREARP